MITRMFKDGPKQAVRGLVRPGPLPSLYFNDLVDYIHIHTVTYICIFLIHSHKIQLKTGPIWLSIGHMHASDTGKWPPHPWAPSPCLLLLDQPWPWDAPYVIFIKN